MTTLATLKAEIADDLLRTDLTAQIAAEITRAIEFYQPKRFSFNETKDMTFATVAGKLWYGKADDADIPLFYALDWAAVNDGGERSYLDQAEPACADWWADTAAISGVPSQFVRYGRAIALYPVPDAAYTVTLAGHYQYPAPAADNTADNAWMTEAYDLIRYRAAGTIAAVKIRDLDMARVFQELSRQSYVRLKAEQSQRTGSGFLRPTEF